MPKNFLGTVTYTIVSNREISKPLLHIQVTGNYHHVAPMSGNGWECRLDETSTSIVNSFFEL